MNENTFASRRTHTRVKFSPLTVSCQLVCVTPQSPAAQTVNTLITPPQYEPNRALSPTAIFPDVRAVDPDNIFPHGPANKYLSLDVGGIAWYVNEQPIDDVWDPRTDFTIDQSDSDTRGTLIVKKNLPASDKAVLHFTGQFLDWRTGIAYTVESDDLALTCTDKGADAVQCYVDKPLIVYDPLFDNLLLYEYKAARGLTVSGNRDDFKDGKCYEQDVNVILTIGTKEVTSLSDTGYKMRVARLGTEIPLTPNSEASPELTYASYPRISFDMRLVAKGEYEVQFFKDDNKVVARSPIGIRTQVTMPTDGQGLRGADIAASQKTYANTAIINVRDRLVEYPELYYLIRWFTQAQYNDNGVWKYAAEKEWQHGTDMLVEVADLGIGKTKNDSFFDYWFTVDAHPTATLCTDEAGNVLTDEAGSFLIC